MTFSNSLVGDTNQQIPKCLECEILYENNKEQIMEILKIVFILAAAFSLGTSRVIQPELAPWYAIDEEQELKKTETSTTQNEEGTGRAFPGNRKTFTHDSSSGPTTVSNYFDLIEVTEATVRRQRRNAEPSCLKGYTSHTFPSGKKVAMAVCHKTAAHDKCLATFKKYGSRSCEPSDTVIVADDHPNEQYKVAIPRNCACKV